MGPGVTWDAGAEMGTGVGIVVEERFMGADTGAGGIGMHSRDMRNRGMRKDKGRISSDKATRHAGEEDTTMAGEVVVEKGIRIVVGEAEEGTPTSRYVFLSILLGYTLVRLIRF